jgi:hypothetical protein
MSYAEKRLCGMLTKESWSVQGSQTRWPYRPNFKEITPPKGEVLDALSVFASWYFFTNNHTFSSIFTYICIRMFDIQCYSKLVDCILYKIVVQHVCLVQGRGHAVARKEMLKIVGFSRFSLTLPSSQLREVSHPVFTKYDESRVYIKSMCAMDMVFCLTQ